MRGPGARALRAPPISMVGPGAQGALGALCYRNPVAFKLQIRFRGDFCVPGGQEEPLLLEEPLLEELLRAPPGPQEELLQEDLLQEELLRHNSRGLKSILSTNGPPRAPIATIFYAS